MYTILCRKGARVRLGKMGRENESDLVLALSLGRNANRVLEHCMIQELHGSVVGAIT